MTTHADTVPGGMRFAVLQREEELIPSDYLVLLDRLPVQDSIVIVNQLAQYFSPFNQVEILFQADAEKDRTVYRNFVLAHLGAAKWTLVLGSFFWHLIVPDILPDIKRSPGCRLLNVGRAKVLKADEFGREHASTASRRTRFAAEYIRYFRLEVEYAAYRVAGEDTTFCNP